MLIILKNNSYYRSFSAFLTLIPISVTCGKVISSPPWLHASCTLCLKNMYIDMIDILFPLLGKELYARNLSLLLPFFESPSIQLKELDKVIFLHNSCSSHIHAITYGSAEGVIFYVNHKKCFDVMFRFNSISLVNIWLLLMEVLILQLLTSYTLWLRVLTTVLYIHITLWQKICVCEDGYRRKHMLIENRIGSNRSHKR